MKTNTEIKTVIWVAFNVVFAIAALASRNPEVHIWALPLIINGICILLNGIKEDE